MEFFSVISAILILWTILPMLFKLIHNMRQPLIGREACIVSKRKCNDSPSGLTGSLSTSFYITFEFKDISFEEFKVEPKQYRLLIEGAQGTLYSKGKWYKRFEQRI